MNKIFRGPFVILAAYSIVAIFLGDLIEIPLVHLHFGISKEVYAGLFGAAVAAFGYIHYESKRQEVEKARAEGALSVEEIASDSIIRFRNTSDLPITLIHTRTNVIDEEYSSTYSIDNQYQKMKEELIATQGSKNDPYKAKYTQDSVLARNETLAIPLKSTHIGGIEFVAVNFVLIEAKYKVLSKTFTRYVFAIFITSTDRFNCKLLEVFHPLYPKVKIGEEWKSEIPEEVRKKYEYNDIGLPPNRFNITRREVIPLNKSWKAKVRTIIT